MKILGKISQVRSSDDSCFINIFSPKGSIGIQTSCLAKPTVLIKRGIHIELVQFSDINTMRDYIEHISHGAEDIQFMVMKDDRDLVNTVPFIVEEDVL